MASKIQKNEQESIVKVLVKDGMVQAPLNLLKKSDVLLEMFNLNDDKSEFLKLSIFEIKDIKLLLKCWEDQSVHSSLKLKSIFKIVQIADYLNEMKLMESIALNAIVPIIDGLNAAEIRMKFSIKPVIIEYDKKIGSFQKSIDELDEHNYLMDLMPLEIVLKMFNALSVKRSIGLRLSFGRKHRYYNHLESAFNERFRKGVQMDDWFERMVANNWYPYSNWFVN